MTEAQRRLRAAQDALTGLENERSRGAQTIAAFAGIENPTDEQRAEFDRLDSGLPDIERRLRSARTVRDEAQREVDAENDAGTTTDNSGLSAERLELRTRSRVGNILSAALSGRAVGGAEAELQSELGLMPNQIPTELWQAPEGERRERAITPAGSTVGVNMAPVEPFVFAPSIAMRLGIAFRQVASGTYAIPRVSTAPSTAAPKAKSADADATAGALTVASATPKRVPARLELAVEDIAAFGNDTFESALRETLSGQLSHSLDNQVINGNGTAPNLDGLIAQLTAPTAQGAEVTWATASDVVAAFIDGLWAMMLSDLVVVINPAGYRKLATTFQAPTTSGANGEVSAASYLMEKLGGLWTNSRMPDTPTSGTLNKNATLIVARMGQPGITKAVIPDWARIQIDDIYSGSAKGERYFTISAIVGDVILVQPDAFQLGAMQVVA